VAEKHVITSENSLIKIMRGKSLHLHAFDIFEVSILFIDNYSGNTTIFIGKAFT
jgi:hypothetical protein